MEKVTVCLVWGLLFVFLGCGVFFDLFVCFGLVVVVVCFVFWFGLVFLFVFLVF